MTLYMACPLSVSSCSRARRSDTFDSNQVPSGDSLSDARLHRAKSRLQRKSLPRDDRLFPRPRTRDLSPHRTLISEETGEILFPAEPSWECIQKYELYRSAAATPARIPETDDLKSAAHSQAGYYAPRNQNDVGYIFIRNFRHERIEIWKVKNPPQWSRASPWPGRIDMIAMGERVLFVVLNELWDFEKLIYLTRDYAQQGADLKSYPGDD
jgi:hypothetical protein